MTMNQSYTLHFLKNVDGVPFWQIPSVKMGNPLTLHKWQNQFSKLDQILDILFLPHMDYITSHPYIYSPALLFWNLIADFSFCHVQASYTHQVFE